MVGFSLIPGAPKPTGKKKVVIKPLTLFLMALSVASVAHRSMFSLTGQVKNGEVSSSPTTTGRTRDSSATERNTISTGIAQPTTAAWAKSSETRQLDLWNSSISCQTPERDYRSHATCHCYNCCVYDKIVHVFDVADGRAPYFSNTTSQYMSARQTFGILHGSRDQSPVKESFVGTPWVETPVHYTSIGHQHILALWLWNADVWSTWRTEGWTDKTFGPFHWMAMNFITRKDRRYLSTTWFASAHPSREAPVPLDDEPNTRVCYRHLMIGHHHTGEKLIAHVFGKGVSRPTYIIDETMADRLSKYKDHFVAETGLDNIKPSPKKALLISRKDSDNGRKIINERQLVSILEDEGYTVEEVAFSDLTFEESNKKIRGAGLVFGSHGAGFANIMVCQKSSVVLEMHPFGFQKWGYAHLAKVLGLDYRYWVAPNENFTEHSEASSQFEEHQRNFYRHRNYHVDVDEFRAIVRDIKGTGPGGSRH